MTQFEDLQEWTHLVVVANGVIGDNFNTPDEGTSEFDLVPNKSKKKNIKNILSNSFGFGGTNASLIFGSID